MSVLCATVHKAMEILQVSHSILCESKLVILKGAVSVCGEEIEICGTVVVQGGTSDAALIMPLKVAVLTMD